MDLHFVPFTILPSVRARVTGEMVYIEPSLLWAVILDIKSSNWSIVFSYNPMALVPNNRLELPNLRRDVVVVAKTEIVNVPTI